MEDSISIDKQTSLTFIGKKMYVCERERFIMCVRRGKGKIMQDYAVMFGKTKRKLEREEKKNKIPTVHDSCHRGREDNS